MKTYKVVQAQSEKRLTIINPHEWASMAYNNFYAENPDRSYIGTHPPGTILKEDQVMEVGQYFFAGEWHECAQHAFLEAIRRNSKELTRTVFTDAEPVLEKPDTSKAMQELFNHLSEEHGLTLVYSELQEIVRLAKVVLESEGYSF